MSDPSRRSFLKHTAAASAGASAWAWTGGINADGANERLTVGVIGDVLVAKAWNIQRRGSIGHEQPSEPPAGVDYDAWVGSAEFLPFQKNRFHYHWHWWYNFGTGDIGNDGKHEIDYARWGLGVEGLPATATGLGGNYFFDDEQANALLSRKYREGGHWAIPKGVPS